MKAVPDSMKYVLFAEADYQCAWCGYRRGLDLECHHIFPRSKGGETAYSNLIALCAACHRLADKGTISAKELRRVKRHLVQRLFTPSGVNAAKVAFRHPEGYVPVHPYAVHHLVELGIFDPVQVAQSVNVEGAQEDVIVLAIYQLTQKGRDAVQEWLLTDDEDDVDAIFDGWPGYNVHGLLANGGESET